MSRDKKDDGESPADWVVRHSRMPRTLHTTAQEQAEIRRRTEAIEPTIPTPRRYYQSARNWRPTDRALLNNIDNAWRKDKPPPYDEYDPIARCCDPDLDDSCPNVTTRMAQSKRWRRLFAVLLVLFVGFVYAWIYYIWPAMEYDYQLKVGFLRQPRGTYGMAAGGEYEFAKERIVQLDNALLPGGVEDPEGRRRLVFVGDIHGCKTELLQLLKHVNFDSKTDHLVATGDVVSKGPDSAGVVDELIRLKASSVRGNHEDRILTLAAVKTDKFGEPELLSKASKRDSELLKSLKHRHLEFLRGLPLILRIPPLPLATASKHAKQSIRSEILVVHAGLVPAVPLKKQDPYFVMNMRSLAQTTHVPSDLPANKHAKLLPWVDSWNWYHGRLAKGRTITGWHSPEQGLEQDDGSLTWMELLASYFQQDFQPKIKAKAQTVVYGHDSRAGFVNKRWSKGLDSGCVRGGALTAMVLDAQGRESFYSVDCKDHSA